MQGVRTLPATLDLERPARLVVCALLIGLGLAMIVANATSWGLEDWHTYRTAAERVASGGPVYDWSGGHEYLYRYSPWFAYALVPLLAVPNVALLWSALVVAGTLAAVAPLFIRPSLESVAFGTFMTGMLMRVASTGNVHPVLVAALVLGLHTRAGPVVVALAASLKATPILFALVFVAERRWWAVAVTLGLTALLVAPMLWLGYRTTPGPSETIYADSPLAWAAIAAVAVAWAGWLAWRRSDLTTLGAAAAAVLALPRAFMYDVSLLLVAQHRTQHVGDTPAPVDQRRVALRGGHGGPLGVRPGAVGAERADDRL